MNVDTLENDPQWYKDAIIYELHVRAFCDSNADGIGDFKGLTQKLDYLQDLGVTAIWLFPFVLLPSGTMGMIFQTIQISIRITGHGETFRPLSGKRISGDYG